MDLISYDPGMARGSVYEIQNGEAIPAKLKNEPELCNQVLFTRPSHPRAVHHTTLLVGITSTCSMNIGY